MSNSALVTYTKLSPNMNAPRNHVIDTITIHVMDGDLSIERCGDLFAKKSKRASSNYGIGTDGRIALYVDEANRSWCSSNSKNDNRAVTIEVANDGGAPDYHVSNAAMASLINLLVDICKRNGIKKLVWSTNKNDRVNHVNGCNMTVHRDFKAKACPGEYLYSHHRYIADEVNKRLGVTSSASSTGTPSAANKCLFKVKVITGALNIRRGPGTMCEKTGCIRDGGVYTIVETSKNWGKLKSGAGWICLDYTKRV